jgi:hypothetical protein
MLDTQNQTLVTIACVQVNVIAPNFHFGILGNLTTSIQSMPQFIEHIVGKKVMIPPKPKMHCLVSVNCSWLIHAPCWF